MLQSGIRRYLRHGTLPQLRVFEASARLGNLTRAAEELHIAQPTASVQIRKLTETVGLPLSNRWASASTSRTLESAFMQAAMTYSVHCRRSMMR